MKISREIPQKMKTYVPYDPAIRLLDIYLKETKSESQRPTCTPMFIAVLFTVAKTENDQNVC